MVEVWYTGQVIAVEEIEAVDAALVAAYPATYLGLNYEGGRQLLRLLFTGPVTEADNFNIGALVSRAPVFNRRVSSLFDRRPAWR